MKIKIVTLLCCFFIILVNAQKTAIDSLEAYAKKAKPGWDKIDIAVGLGRLYSNAASFDKAQLQINNIHKWSEDYNIPSAVSYGLTLEGCMAYSASENAEKGISLFKQAIEIAEEENNKDALAYATNEYVKTLIWNKGDTQNGMDILFSLLEEMDETVSEKHKGTSYLSLAHGYMLLGKYDDSHTYFDKALSCFQQMIETPRIDPKINRVSAHLANPMRHIGYTYNDLGNLYLKTGHTTKAYDYKKKALNAIKETNSIPYIAWMHVNLAKVYRTLGDYEKALEYIAIARKMYESIDFKADIAWTDAIMTTMFFNLKDYNMAELYCKKNLDYLEEYDINSKYYGQTLLSMASIQLNKDNVSLANFYIQKAETAISKVDNSGNKAKINRLKGELYLKEGQLEKSKAIFKKAIVYNQERNFQPEEVLCEYYLATIFFKQHQLDSSIIHTNKVLDKGRKINDIDLIKKGYDLLSNIYAANEDYENAYKNQQQFLKYNDSLYTTTAINKLKSEQVRQDVYGIKTEKELVERTATLLAQRNRLYIISGIILMSVLSLLVYFYLNLRKAKAKTLSQNIQLKQLNQTKDKFFGIIAHDIRSPLIGLQSVGNQINYYIKKDQPGKLLELSKHIDESSKKLTDLLDNLLNWALLQNGMIPYNPNKINLNEIIDDVIGLLQPIANMKNITLTHNLDNQYEVYADSKAVHTILRNIVSNALKFTNTDGEVKIKVNTKNNDCIITVSDNGIGIATEKLPELFTMDKQSQNGTLGETGSGLGLMLSKELVELNKGIINVVSTLDKGSSFIFNLPKSV